MPKPDVVVFDLGKVLIDFDYSIAGRKLSARSRLTPAQMQLILESVPLLHRFEHGRMTPQEFYGEVCAQCGYSGTLAEFSTDFADIFAEMPAMIQMQQALKKNGVPTYIFSNTNPIAIPHIQGRYPFFANFDGYIYSYEHGAMKPTPLLYEVVEKMTGRKGAEILYLDDRAENMAAGLARGWQGWIHHDAEETISRMRQLGLPVDSNS